MVTKALVYPSGNPSLYYIQGNRLYRRQLCKCYCRSSLIIKLVDFYSFFLKVKI